MLKIEKLKEQADVYDITVEDTHNFFANNILVHNCTEILEHVVATKYNSKTGKVLEVGETAVCNLASINLLSHVEKGKINWDKLQKTIHSQVEALDNVIDLNFYPIEEAENSNKLYRPIGLGIMGFHDMCNALDIVYCSDKGIELASKVQEFISYHAILRSSLSAKEKGKYPKYEGSTWSKGIFPIDTYIELMKQRGKEVKEAHEYETLDWSVVRESVKQNGMRNGLTQAIAPTATIGDIYGVSPCVDPDFSILFVKSTLSGEFTVVNSFFVEDMKKENLWCPELLDAIKKVDGNVSLLNVPNKYKEKYKSAFEVDIFKFIDAAAERQKWIDQGQSLNLYSNKESMKYLNDMYFYAWEKGLKTTYYLRTLSASTIEKSTVSNKEVVKLDSEEVKEEAIKLCSLEAKLRGEICESCQ
jgi:ribonucleoside-diphosphate reductase alpha chain